MIGRTVNKDSPRVLGQTRMTQHFGLTPELGFFKTCCTPLSVPGFRAPRSLGERTRVMRSVNPLFMEMPFIAQSTEEVTWAELNDIIMLRAFGSASVIS